MSKSEIRKNSMYLMPLYASFLLAVPKPKLSVREDNQELLPRLDDQEISQKLEKLKENYHLERRLFL
jgi:hypothetical protein